MNITPIPLNALIHTVTHRSPAAKDKWGNVTYNETVLKRVKLEPKQTLVYTKDNEKVTLAARLFIDTVKSMGAWRDVRVDDKIVFNGREYTVQTVEAFYAFGNIPHHLEVGLI